MYAHVNTPPAPPSNHRPGLSPHLDALLAELLAKDPGDRPASAARVRDRLSHPPASSPPGPPPARPATAKPSHQPWTHTTGDGVRSSPAVVDGTVYIGSWDEKVYALDAATGTPRWTYTTGGAVYSSPAVMDGTVYIGSHDTKVYALDAATGTPRWIHTTGS